MTDPVTVGEIIKQYERHGWTLRRALLSDDARVALSATLGEIEFVSSDLDALWFSRKSKPESESWELRRLTSSPFALVAVVEADASDEELESALEQVADDMLARS
ncbi:MAG: hypothetical protein DMF63_07950 [Acidobacteria bacterium]|nr:MAG: hypothetical protein DMF63_07950 [Acidobacteriota bacterium]